MTEEAPKEYDLSGLTLHQQMAFREIQLKIPKMSREQLAESVLFLTIKNYQTLNAAQDVVKGMLKAS